MKFSYFLNLIGLRRILGKELMCAWLFRRFLHSLVLLTCISALIQLLFLVLNKLFFSNLFISLLCLDFKYSKTKFQQNKIHLNTLISRLSFIRFSKPWPAHILGRQPPQIPILHNLLPNPQPPYLHIILCLDILKVIMCPYLLRWPRKVLSYLFLIPPKLPEYIYP